MQGNHPFKSAKLIHDDAKIAALFFELLENIDGELIFRNKNRLPNDAPDLKSRFIFFGKKIFDMQVAQDIVVFVFTNWKLKMIAL
nr:hypothetical protein [Haliscomenobacter sp.]